MPLENHHAFGAPTGFYWSSRQHEPIGAPTCLPGHFLFQNKVALVWGYEYRTFLISGQTNRLETTPINCKLTDADLIVEVPFTIVCKNVFTIPSFKLKKTQF